MAGAGRKVFTPGEILRAADVNGFLMDQAVQVFDDATERDLALGTAVVSQGMVSYVKDVDELQVYTSEWEQVYPRVPLAGEIVQVVQYVKSDTFSSSVASGGFIQPTGFEISITPKLASNKIMVFLTIHGSATTLSNSATAHFRLLRDGTAVGIGDAASSRPRLTGAITGGSPNGDAIGGASAHFLDSPSTTSAVVYSVQLYNLSGTTQTLYLNRNVSDTNSQVGLRLISSITVMEVVA
jgi:hypothetical protein